MATGVRFPFGIVEYDAYTWAMVYCNTATNQVEYATSPKGDPHSWSKAGVILTAANGLIRGGAVLLDGGVYHILYDTQGQFCYASGSALGNLVKHDANDEPVFSGQGDGWEKFVRHPALMRVDGVYHMWYDGRADHPKGSNGDIGHARSEDMIDWIRDDNPVLTRGVDAWEAGDVGTPHVALIGGVCHLFYSGYDNSGPPSPHWIGYATSDSVNGPWVKAATNPILGPGLPGAWDENLVMSPVVLQSGGDVYLYYHGSKNNNAVTAIGYALRSWPRIG